MQQGLKHEAEYFDEKKRLLRAIFNETLSHTADVYRSRRITKDKLNEMGLKCDDERYIRNMLENPISIVLMGNRPCVKARMVNYILGYELLPVFDFYDSDYNRPRRSVRIMYGTNRRHSFCIRHFELLECAPSHTERVVSFDDLRLDPVFTRFGVRSACSNNSITTTADGPLSMATSGLESGGEQSNTPTTVSFNSSSSLHKSDPSSAGNASPGAATTRTNSSGFSSQGRQLDAKNFVDVGLDEDDDDDDEEEFGEIDFTNETTTLEIVLPHELLEKNLQIRVAPDVDNFETIYRTTFHRTNPIIIYCFERHNDKLSDIDSSHLQQLRHLMPSTPVLFAHIVDFDPTYHTCRLGPTSQMMPTLASSINPNYHHYSPLPPTSAGFTLQPQIPVKGQCDSPLCNCSRSELTESQQQNKWKNCHYQNVAAIGEVKGQGQCSCQTVLKEPLCVSCCASISSRKMSTASTIGSGNKHVHHRDCHCDDNQSYLQASESIWNQLKRMGFFQETPGTVALQGPLDRQAKRSSNGYYIVNDRPFKCTKQNADHGLDVSSRFICHSYEFCYFVDFFRAILKSNLVVAATLLNEIHNQFIQHYIFTAFDMTWSLNYSIPKRLEYARRKEAELYMSLMSIANRKQEEIRQLIGEMMDFMREDILNQAANYIFTNPCLESENVKISGPQLKDCIEEIQEFVFIMLNRAIAIKLMSSVDVMRESFIGTLKRCLEMLESYRCDDHDKVKKEEKIDYALSRLLNLAYAIEINVGTCSSILRSFWDKLKNFFLILSLTEQSAVVNKEWKQKVASDLISNLSEAKLAKCICSQFREKLKSAHETFVTSLANLESSLAGKMKETDHRRQQVRKTDAPMFARLALESTSFIDSILYGSPELGKELGRGQYGVVFSSKKSWGHYSRIAIKSIMICDDNHWNDLAMEFYYARSLPENDRIVQIRGSIIEHNHSGTSSYVYLILDRLPRDLYAGLKVGLSWLVRLQISLDVIHGLRFLHNHGLIHRDIKLKNVLLDKFNRAKITDLGFCKSEVMISGSIVGTPIHMAPEVFTGKYDSLVDVYAFGILFWYICAGSVELPQIFEQCHNKDHLWLAVKKGLRPEKLPFFDDDCYNLMERCWHGESTRRPLLGEVEETLWEIKNRAQLEIRNGSSH